MLLSRRYFFFGSLALPLLAARKKKLEIDRPNLLLILVDGLPCWMLGCYGNKDVRTPNIDRLSQTGTRFVNAFASVPSAVANRNVCLTGRVARSADEPPAASLLDPALAADGYNSQTVGGPAFSESTGAAVKFLDRQAAGKPFGLTVFYSGLEPPYDGVPREFLDLYENQRFDEWAADPPARNAVRGKEMFGARMANLRKASAAVTAHDAEIGKLLTKLYEKRLLNDTMVVLASTCGALLGRHGLWGSGDASDPPNMYEEVVNTPLIWSYSKRIPPSIMQVGLVSAYDLLPTLCDVIGVQQAIKDPFGLTYAPLVNGTQFSKKRPWRTTVFAHLRNTDMARVDRYKLVVRDEGKGSGELYDLRVDRAEIANQYGDAQFEDVKNNLSGQMTQWKKYLAR